MGDRVTKKKKGRRHVVVGRGWRRLSPIPYDSPHHPQGVFFSGSPMVSAALVALRLRASDHRPNAAPAKRTHDGSTWSERGGRLAHAP